MTQEDIITPIATVATRQCMITSPWFVQNTEYSPMPATYKPLVNGEEAFAAVYHAIMNAQKTVVISYFPLKTSTGAIASNKI